MKSMAKMFFGALLLVVALVGGIFTYSFYQFAYTPGSLGVHEPLVIEVTKGQGPSDISRTVMEKGIVSDRRYFGWLGRLGHFWKGIKAGEYELNAGMTPLEVFSVLTSGVSLQHPITIREGENMMDVASDLQAKNLATRERFLRLCRSREFIATLGIPAPAPATLEGYLYPETYFFNRVSTPEEIIHKMVKKFTEVWGKAEQERAHVLGMTREQVITLASMIEKETGVPAERPMISAVFHNRLRKGMRLQSDPTTVYGLGDRYKGNIHKADLQDKSAYNTYVIPALPVGPIGNPGNDAIQAALFPVQSEFLFFVSHNDGTHEFTRNYDDHRLAVRKFQLNPKAREGKSWRDFSKKQREMRAAASSKPE